MYHSQMMHILCYKKIIETLSAIAPITSSRICDRISPSTISPTDGHFTDNERSHFRRFVLLEAAIAYFLYGDNIEPQSLMLVHVNPFLRPKNTKTWGFY